jgi:shikimate kinase
VVLVGFMGSGKSAVGAVLARRLGWEHLDLDREIEAREGRTIPEIFRTEGERRFRALEAEVTASLAGRTGVVLSPGGGWITSPGLLERLGPGTLSVWLRVSPETVLERVARTRADRPLLDVPDPLAAVRRLLREREPLYARAELVVDTDGRGVAEVAALVQEATRRRGTGVQQGGPAAHELKRHPGP